MIAPGAGSNAGAPVRGQAWLDTVPARALAAARSNTPGEWEFRLDGSRRRARLLLGGGWLCLASRLRSAARDLDGKQVDAGLRRNAKLAGLPREIGAGAGRERHLVIDIPAELLPAHDPDEFGGLLAQLLASLAHALGIADAAPADEGAQTANLTDEQLESVFALAAWPLRRIDQQRLAVPLEVAGEFFAAELEQTAAGLCLRVPLYADAYRAAAADCRRAFCALLWLTCNRARMVRAALAGRQPWIEVNLPSATIDAAAAAHGCAALAATLHRLAREAQLLLDDERLARLFLEVIGFTPARRAASPRRAAR